MSVQRVYIVHGTGEEGSPYQVKSYADKERCPMCKPSRQAAIDDEVQLQTWIIESQRRQIADAERAIAKAERSLKAMVELSKRKR